MLVLLHVVARHLQLKHRRFFQLIFAFVVCWVCGTVVAVELLNIRWSDGPRYSRFVFDLSARTTFKYDKLENPARFYIDLDNTRLARGFVRPVLDSKAVAKIRYGVQDGNKLRVVLDLIVNRVPDVSELGPHGNRGHRVIIDVPRTEPKRECVTEPHKDVVILIDAGHGGEEPGAIAVNGELEKDIVLSISKYLKAFIEMNPGFKVVMSRSGDYEVPLEARKDLAEQERAHLFVSVHADAFRTPQPRGASVFVLSDGKARDEMAQWLEENENRSDWVGGVSEWVNSECFERPQDLLFLNSKSQQEALVEAVSIGKSVLESLDLMATIHPRSIDRRAGKYRVSDAGFVVLKSTSVPSILVESGFLSNPTEARLLSTESYQQDIARSLARGIVRHFCEQPPWHTDLANGIVDCLPTTHVHIVKRGDTLSEIALANKVTVQALRKINNLKRDIIRIGQELTIPVK